MAHLAAALILLLSPAARAQNLRGTLSAPALPTVRLSPGLGAAALSPSAPLLALPRFAAPVLPTAILSGVEGPALTLSAAALPNPVIPAATPAAAKATMESVSAAAAPALQALSKPNVSGSAAHGVGIALEDALTGRRSAGAVFAAP